MANRMKTSWLICSVMCVLLAMADARVGRDPLPSLNKPGMVTTESLPSEEPWKKPTVMIDDNGVAICTRYQCSYNSFAELNRTFAGLFPTLEEYQRQTGLPVMSNNTCAYVFKERSSREAPLTQSQCRIGPGDGDDCCPTGQQSNNCGDKCTSETNLMHLYAYNNRTQSRGFNIFQIESYCSCKALRNL